MDVTTVSIVKLIADEGKVFDWKEPRVRKQLIDESNPSAGLKEIEEHLYAKLLYLSDYDSILNYIEVDESIIGEE